MPKRRPGGKRRRRHLYLAFDDSPCGYSIRKVDLPSDSDSDDGDEEPPRQHGSGDELLLPLRPAVFRLEAPRGLPHYFTAAFGTRILAMHPKKPGTDGKLCLMSDDLLVPVFDVRSRGVIFAPRHRADLADPIYIPVGEDRLFALASGSFEQLWPPPLEYPGGEHFVWTWQELPEPSFERRHVTSYAVHPDRGTITVSTERGATAATFILDTEAPYFVWRQLGRWVLPFDGCSHFDRELDAFVGLSKDRDTLGHICSCDMASSDGAGEGRCLAPAWKLGKEKLFSEDPAEKHEGATLLYMGRKSRFCLVQCISNSPSRMAASMRRCRSNIRWPCHVVIYFD